MILVPGLMKLGTPILPMVKDIATKLAARKGVAVLTPSGAAAKEWADIAEYPEKSSAVAEKVAEMQAGDTFGPLVLANRYDGIDLAGNACRILVMDNLPQGTTNYDVFRMNVVRRDPDWVAYHASELADAAHAPPIDQLALKVAAVERKAFKLQRLARYEKALAAIEKLMGDEALAADAQRRAWLAASAARIAYR